MAIIIYYRIMKNMSFINFLLALASKMISLHTSGIAHDIMRYGNRSIVNLGNIFAESCYSM